MRLVDLLMREEGPETAIEEIDEPSSPPHASETMLVDAVGHESMASPAGESWVTAAPQPVARVDSEDEDEMLLEV